MYTAIGGNCNLQAEIFVELLGFFWADKEGYFDKDKKTAARKNLSRQFLLQF